MLAPIFSFRRVGVHAAPSSPQGTRSIMPKWFSKVPSNLTLMKILFFTAANFTFLGILYGVNRGTILNTRERRVLISIENATRVDDTLPVTKTDLPFENFQLKPPNKSEKLINEQVAESNPNVINSELNHITPKLNNTCAWYVHTWNVKFNNLYWQVQKTKNVTYLLYGAYYDNRPRNLNGTVLRVLGMVDKIDPPISLHCLMWFVNETKPFISKMYEYQYMWRSEWGFWQEPLQPYLMSCKVPPELGNRVPESVTVVEDICPTGTNNLRVIYNTPPSGRKKDFAVCVKGLNFYNWPDIAVRLVEWLELLRILGVEKVIIYQLTVDPKIETVLKYYEKLNNSKFEVDVEHTTLPGEFSNVPSLMEEYLWKRLPIQLFQEMIQYDDCFYKNFHQFKFISLLDIDEVILPKTVSTWQQLMYGKVIPMAKKQRNITWSSFVATNVHFMDDAAELNEWFPHIPQYMHMLQHVRRNKEYIGMGGGIKCIHDTELILSLHNHYPRACIGDKTFWCPTFEMDRKDVHLQHYCFGRGKDVCQTKPGKDMIMDTSIWQYNNDLIPAVRKVLKGAGIIDKNAP
ncbi:uncharacterized protein LOC132195484 [Neocloeon triangulifer]|uniref:uncharacterized protein LOC132195484 n=1 Tax=Neocloeon triangulifer TaxID=2078957 RepID=UPI00286F79AB|nr:uncharacterized protein LOC132195484 [Neocloeon triangulifer]